MIKQIFSCASKLIIDQEQVINDIKNRKTLSNYFIRNNLAILICTLIYGAVLGTYVGGNQILINSLKTPILFFMTLYISLPVFYILDLLSGSKIKFSQMSVLLVTGYAIASIIMIAFTPVVLFFILTAKEYYFTVFLTVGVLGLSGYFSLIYIYKNFQLFHEDNKWYPSLTVGSFIIIFVGTQLSWTLRPFFHTYNSFVRPPQGNFYVEIAKGVSEHPYIAGPLLFIFMFIAFLITAIIYTKKLESQSKSDEPTATTPSGPNPLINAQYPVYPQINPGIMQNPIDRKLAENNKEGSEPTPSLSTL